MEVTSATVMDESSTTKDLIVAKAVVMVVLAVASFLLGLLPLKLTKFATLTTTSGEKNLLLSLLLCFGGGVLLFTTFIHLQPEVREFFSKKEANHELPDLGLKGLPVSELIFCFGFFFVYLIEELVHAFLERKTDDKTLQRTLSVRCSSRKGDNATIPRVTLTKLEDGNLTYVTANSNKELLTAQSAVGAEKLAAQHEHPELDDSLKQSFSGFLAVLALSFHAIFEGLAVGLESSVDKVWYLFAAMATHKLVIAFCVGVELVSSKMKTMMVVVYIFTFTIVTPIGIGIGIILRDLENNQENTVCVILQGMAAGTLLYVVFFEILGRERDNQHCGLWQLLAILCGFLLMFALQILTGHEHSAGDQGFVPAELTTQIFEGTDQLG